MLPSLIRPLFQAAPEILAGAFAFLAAPRGTMLGLSFELTDPAPQAIQGGRLPVLSSSK
jgi:hypothetical protein